jgi:hypothetical protein
VQQPDPAAAQITLTAHCLLRLMTALLLETQGAVPFLPSATAAQWVDLLMPYFRRRFSPGEQSAWPD